MKRYKAERKGTKLIKQEMDEYEYLAFIYKNSNLQLFDNVIDDGVSTYSIITSYKENNKLESILEDISNEIDDINKELDKYPIKKKYRKIFNSVLKYSDENKLRINIFRVYLKYVVGYDFYLSWSQPNYKKIMNGGIKNGKKQERQEEK